MSVAAVRAALAPFGRDGDVREFDAASATVQQAADAIGADPDRIAKTIAVYGDGGDASTAGRPAAGVALLVVTAGDARLHSGAFKRAFGFKPHMVAREEVEALTGHPVGGVCPFANPEGTQVWLEESLRRFETVWPACGSTNSAVELGLADLERLSGARGWVDVCKGWREPVDPSA